MSDREQRKQKEEDLGKLLDVFPQYISIAGADGKRIYSGSIMAIVRAASYGWPNNRISSPGRLLRKRTDRKCLGTRLKAGSAVQRSCRQARNTASTLETKIRSRNQETQGSHRLRTRPTPFAKCRNPPFVGIRHFIHKEVSCFQQISPGTPVAKYRNLIGPLPDVRSSPAELAQRHRENSFMKSRSGYCNQEKTDELIDRHYHEHAVEYRMTQARTTMSSSPV